MMRRDDVLQTLIETLPTCPIVFTTGYTCRAANRIADRPNHLYMVGSMGMAAAIGLGVAWQSGRPAVVVDGDGSLLMNPSVMFLASQLRGATMVHVVLDNGSYESTGGQATASSCFDLPAVAQAIGYRSARTVMDLPELATALTALSASGSGPNLLRVPTCPTTAPTGRRIAVSPADNHRRLARWIASGIRE